MWTHTDSYSWHTKDSLLLFFFAGSSRQNLGNFWPKGLDIPCAAADNMLNRVTSQFIKCIRRIKCTKDSGAGVTGDNRKVLRDIYGNRGIVLPLFLFLSGASGTGCHLPWRGLPGNKVISGFRAIHSLFSGPACSEGPVE